MCLSIAPSAFNEVAHQPPSLKLPRGATLNADTRRPGATQHLLLLDKLKQVSSPEFDP
jgi:hypothetical protein